MKYCEVIYKDDPKQFYISYNCVHYNQHTKIAPLYNGIKNFFNGYYVILFRKKNKKYLKRKLGFKN